VVRVVHQCHCNAARLKKRKGPPRGLPGTGLIAIVYLRRSASRSQKSNCALNLTNRAEMSEVGWSHVAPFPL
jgi:hypothetical protein